MPFSLITLSLLIIAPPLLTPRFRRHFRRCADDIDAAIFRHFIFITPKTPLLIHFFADAADFGLPR
jgi:hypothetical protein